MGSQNTQREAEGYHKPQLIDSSVANQTHVLCDQSGKESSTKTSATKSPCSSKKRKRPKEQSTRNVKSKANKKQAPPTKDPSLSQILGPSLDEMIALNTPLPDSGDSFDCSIAVPRASSSPSGDAPERRTGRGQRKGTRLTAVKQQLMELTEENTRLKNSIKLLESEIDTNNKEIVRKKKSVSHQKSEIKRLTNVNDSLRRELSQYKRQEKPPASITNADEENSVRQNKPSALLSDIQGINDKLEHLRHQIGSLESTVQSAINVNETSFINVRHREHRPSQQSRSNSVSRDNVATYAAALDSRMPTVPAHDDRTSSVKPRIAVIGTSLVRGLGPRLT